MKNVLLVLLFLVFVLGISACAVTDNGVYTGTVIRVSEIDSDDRVVAVQVEFQDQPPVSNRDRSVFYYPIEGQYINEVKTIGTKIKLHCNLYGDGVSFGCQFVELVR